MDELLPFLSFPAEMAGFLAKLIRNVPMRASDFGYLDLHACWLFFLTHHH